MTVKFSLSEDEKEKEDADGEKQALEQKFAESFQTGVHSEPTRYQHEYIYATDGEGFEEEASESL